MRTLLITVAAMALVLSGCSSPATEPTPVTHTETATQGTSGTTTPVATQNNPCASADTGPYTAPSASLTGSGATFPKPILEAWALCFNQAKPGVQISYAGGGSGKGISDITAKNVVFAGSDAPLSAAEKANAQKNGETILQFPETLGAIAIVYNLDGIGSGMKLDGQTIGRIYNGEITKWNDAAIVAQNAGMNLPDARIATVARSDSSGTTFAFTDFLMKSSDSWKANHGAAQKSQIANTVLSASGNEGVGGTVASTKNSMGYVELSFMNKLGLSGAMIKNKDGNYIAPSNEGASLDAGVVTLPAPDGDWSAVSIAYAGGGQAYPVSTMTYILVYKDLANYGGAATQAKLDAFKAWMYWVVHDGQQLSGNYGYAPLPAGAVDAGSGA